MAEDKYDLHGEAIRGALLIEHDGKTYTAEYTWWPHDGWDGLFRVIGPVVVVWRKYGKVVSEFAGHIAIGVSLQSRAGRWWFDSFADKPEDRRTLEQFRKTVRVAWEAHAKTENLAEKIIRNWAIDRMLRADMQIKAFAEMLREPTLHRDIWHRIATAPSAAEAFAALKESEFKVPGIENPSYV